MELRDAIVVITGASRGLGAELARAFAKQGAKIVVSARSSNELSLVAKETRGLAVVADVTKENDVKNLANSAVKHFGRINVWINNAGIHVPHCSVEEIYPPRFREMIEVNLFGTVYGSREALTQMKKQHGGVIMNILSSAALEGKLEASAYVASKHAAAGFTKSLRLEANPFNIKVIAVYPGGMKTHFFDEEKPIDFDEYMDPAQVAKKIVENLASNNLQEELIIRRPTSH